MKTEIVLIFITAIFLINCIQKPHNDDSNCAPYQCIREGIVRGNTAVQELSIVFTGGDYADGGEHIFKVLKAQQVKSSFFLTGDFYRNPDFNSLIEKLKSEGHYLGAHSDQHLLYCSWQNRDGLLVSKSEFMSDLQANYNEMKRFGIQPGEARYFIPPYEWYNDSISQWTKEAGFHLVIFTYGTRTNADYTTPDMRSYRSSDEIWKSIIDYDKNSTFGLNGFIMLIHIGTATERTDKFYHRLEELIVWLHEKGYKLIRMDELLGM